MAQIWRFLGQFANLQGGVVTACETTWVLAVVEAKVESGSMTFNSRSISLNKDQKLVIK